MYEKCVVDQQFLCTEILADSPNPTLPNLRVTRSIAFNHAPSRQQTLPEFTEAEAPSAFYQCLALDIQHMIHFEHNGQNELCGMSLADGDRVCNRIFRG